MVFYHSSRLQQATEWWISDNTYIHYINFVSYLKLVHLTLLLACNDLPGLDVAYTLLIKSSRYVQTVAPFALYGDAVPRAKPEKRSSRATVQVFFLWLVKSTSQRGLVGEAFPPLHAELQFWREGGKKNVIWGVKFVSVCEQIGGVKFLVLNLEGLGQLRRTAGLKLQMEDCNKDFIRIRRNNGSRLIIICGREYF